VKSICVYCASSSGIDPSYRLVAEALGRDVGSRGWAVVYGGAHVGLMGLVADSCLAAGGQVFGIIPRSLKEREIAHLGLTRLEIVDSMHERKARMTELADAFVALPGALGTLDELCEALTWAQLGIHHKPVYVLNVNGYWTGFLEFLDRAVREGFLKLENRTLVQAVDGVEELMACLASDNQYYVK